MKKLKKSRFMAVMLSCLLLINTIMTLPVHAATAGMDASNKSKLNPPQDITGKTDIATWGGFPSTGTVTTSDFEAVSGYYKTTPANTASTLQLFKDSPAKKATTGFTYSGSGLQGSGFNTQTDKAYWMFSTSSKGFKDLIFNFNFRSSGTGPRDFNTEWSTDGKNWTVFGEPDETTKWTVKVESQSPPEQFGMVLPAEAANQDTLYIRILLKSEAPEDSTKTFGSGGTNGGSSYQLYGVKDPAFTTPAVTITPDTTNAILDVTPITLSCADNDAQIYYTTDGTTPATTEVGSTKLYKGPFTALSAEGFKSANDYVVKAVAKSGTLLPCDTVTSTFKQQTITSNADAKKLAAGTYAWVKGIGTYLIGTNTLYIQDGMNVGSGFCIYKSGADFTAYLNKEIYVYGKATVNYGLMEIVPDAVNDINVVVRNDSPALPTPIKIMFDQLQDRAYEGMLVSCDTVKLDNIAGTDDTKTVNHTVSQAGISGITLRANGITTDKSSTGYVDIAKAIASYYNGVQLLSSKPADLVAAATPTVEFMSANVATGTAVPLNSNVTLSTPTSDATITYSLNGGTPVTSTGNSVDVTIDAFQGGIATITASATAGSYTTAEQTFTYTQRQVEAVTANPENGAVAAGTQVTLTSKTAGATIVYSLYNGQGALVGDADQTYTAPITLDAASFPVKIVTKAILTNYLDSNPVTFNYTAKKAVGGEKNYYGAIHGHTAENSDGQGNLVEADAYARDQGKFDYFILTDHSNSFDKAPAGDSVAAIGNLNTYNTANQQWLNGKNAAKDATTSTFLCDYGYEMTWSGGPGHINTFNTAGFVSRNNTALNNKTNDAGMKAYYDLLKNTPGSISQFNHPGPTFGNFSDFAYYDPQIDDKINLVEVGNGEGAVGSGGYFPSIDQYILALDKGWHVAPTNNGDNHKKGWGTSNTCATVVYTNDFTMAGIYQAMRDRSVWATENRDLDVTYHLSDGTNTYSMGAILDSAPATANITVTAKNKNVAAATSNIATIQLISGGGRVVDKKTYSAGSSDVTYTYNMTTPKAGYYFVKITDNQGFNAVTAPIWLGSAAKVGITSVANNTVMPVTTEAMKLTTTFFNNESTAATLKSISYTVDGDASANKSYTLGTSIPALGTANHEFSYTPTTPGNKTVTISAVVTVNGVDTTYTATSTMKVVDIGKVLYVGLDASHGNEYVSGGSYPSSMGNMMALAAKNDIRVVQLNTSEDFIKACNNPKYKMMILNAPSRKSVAAWPTPTNYTPDEIAALKTFAENGNTLVFGIIADYAESSNKDVDNKHMSELQNEVLSAIGSTLREGDDEVIDDDSNGGQGYRLYPTEFNMVNPLMQGVVSGQTYSQYSGSTIYAVDPKTGDRTTTLPSTVSPLVFGFPTTYSAETDKDNFGYGTSKDPFPFVAFGANNQTDKGMNNSQGLYIPKYVNPNSKIADKPEEKLLAASETVVHSNGNTSLVVVAGGSFMSNFEIQVTMENAGTLPYSNYNIMDNLYKTVNPLTITSIADAKKLPDGTEDVIIEGTATCDVNTQNVNTDTNKGFTDCIYVQDSTGGINLFPVATGIKEGQKARFYGKITHYQGEVELTVSKFTILDESINKIEPTVLSSKTSMLPENTGLLVKTQGVVSNIDKGSDGTINQFTINDGTGPAIVFINGYITKGTTLPFIKDGATVSVVGLTSIGEVMNDSNMHARIRVRDRAEIVNIENSTGGGDNTGGSTGDNTGGSTGGNNGGSTGGNTSDVQVPVVTKVDGNSNVTATIDSSKVNNNAKNIISIDEPKVESKIQVQLPANVIANGTGSFEIKTNTVSLNIPAGVVDSSLLSNGSYVQVSKNVMSTADANALLAYKPQGAKNNGTIFTFGMAIYDNNNNLTGDIHNFANNKNVAVTLNLTNNDIKGMDTSKISAFYFDDSSKKWVDLGGSFDDSKMTYTFITSHFTNFTIMEKASATVQRTVQRLAGNNRIETSLAIAKEQFANKAPDAIVIATANDYPDALSGSALAYKYNAPMLLINKTVNDSKNVIDYITANLSKGKNIYILGETGAVSKEISDYLTAQGYNIIRLGGKDRYETNKKIVDYLNVAKGTSLVIATGNDFADALSVSSIADINGYPILLSGKDSLSTYASNYIANMQPTTIYVVGGTGVISTNIETQIKKLSGNINIVRLGGADRYETSMKIAEYFNLKTSTVTLATGTNFPDALSGSVLAARNNSSILLVDNKDISKQKDLIDKNQITNVIVFGGEGVISKDIADSLINK